MRKKSPERGFTESEEFIQALFHEPERKVDKVARWFKRFSFLVWRCVTTLLFVTAVLFITFAEIEKTAFNDDSLNIPYRW